MPATTPLSARAAAPAVLPLPGGSLSWRPLVPQDAAALHRLIEAVEVADAEPARMAPGEVAELLADESTDLSADSLVGVDDGGSLRAYALVTSPAGDRTIRRAFLHGGVDPEFRGRGIGTALLAWSTGRARQVLGACEEAVPGRIGAFVHDEAPAAARELYRAAGYSPVRYYSDLRRDLADPVHDAPLGGGLRLAPWTPDLDDATRLAHNDSFRDHWGSQPRTMAAWTHGRSTFAPEWTFVVIDDDPAVELDPETLASREAGAPVVAGYHWADRYEADFPVRGYTFGYTSLLGVRRAWRGRGIAPALLAAGMRAFAADGMQYAALDVDAENPSGAHGLYERLGYTRTGGSQLVTIEL